MNTIIQQPYKGRWELSRDDVSIGVVNGDHEIGFTARDPLGNTLGHYSGSVEALGAVVYVADIRGLEASWAMTEGPS
jgi:hypothetical protein